MSIFINQVGYLPQGEKYFLATNEATNFNIVDLKDKVVHSGSISKIKKRDRATGEVLYLGDFSSFTTPGNYYVEIDTKRSYCFKISEDIYNNVLDKAIDSYYYQRSGVDLNKSEVGSFERKAGHNYELEYHPSSQVTGKKDVTGGWYDAGDYGRYIIPASVTLSTMLIGYEKYPQKFQNGNGIVPFLDEVKFELEWMLKMQYKEEGEFKGALPYMINSKGYVSGLPEFADGIQYIYDFSSIATADFAAVMAQASRIFKDIDSELSKQCLEAALLAWDFLKNRPTYPEGGYQRPSDTDTGGYAQYAKDNKNDKDDRLWAAVELYITTNDEVFHNYFLENSRSLTKGWGMQWNGKPFFPKYQYLTLRHGQYDEKLMEKFKKSFVSECDSLICKIDNNSFRTTLGQDEYIWGSNGEVLNRAEKLILGYELTQNTKYYNGALYQLNYVLGLNIHNLSFVTKIGSNYPKKIHHAIFIATNYVDTYPGLIAGGPNGTSNSDETLPLYFNKKTPPGKCYIDHEDSYASNESCILYNAPLVPVSAYFSK